MAISRRDAVKARIAVKDAFGLSSGNSHLDRASSLLKKSGKSIKNNENDIKKIKTDSSFTVLNADNVLASHNFKRGDSMDWMKQVVNAVSSALTKSTTNNTASSVNNTSSMPFYDTPGSMPNSAYQAMADKNNDLSLSINRENNQFNADQAALNRAWQESLANSAHQREVVDLKAAGLNPVLSAGGSGAVTPAGSTASNASYANVSGDSVIGALATLAASAMSANAVMSAAQTNARANMYSSDNALKGVELTNQSNQDINSENLTKTWPSLVYKMFKEDNFISEVAEKVANFGYHGKSSKHGATSHF